MRLWQGTLAAAVAALVLCAAPASATGAGWLIGAARVDITPPGPGADPAAFASCPAAIYSGARPFSFNEPYRDLNGNGRFDYPEPFCDANVNGRYDGIYSSGGVDHLADGVHDPMDARAVALSHGGRTVVLVSVVAQGLFQNYTERMRELAMAERPGITGMIVSANHNESSPDTIGIYGAPADPTGAFGLHSGIDDYYMSWLEQRVAHAAVKAFDTRRPGTLRARQFQLPAGVRVDLSDNFPTTDDSGAPAAVDPKAGVLQARDSSGKPIFTLMSLAAHNQEIGHSDDPAVALRLSSDWPGYFAARTEALGEGMGVFFVGDNGSEEDPETVPPVSCATGCWAQAQATGEALANAVAAEASAATPVRPGDPGVQRKELYVPLENNLFRAAAAAGLFGDRQTYIGGLPAGRAGNELLTEVNVADLGPDLQLIGNPGEAFPALMLGSRWGIDEVGCPERANPPVPTWRASARFRLQVGLANDMIGYEIPPWAFSSQPGVFTTSYGDDLTCVNDSSDRDPKGHQHKLETEGVGPTAAAMVAGTLTDLLSARPDPSARIRPGRFIQPDGALTRNAAGAVGVWIANPPGRGTILALKDVKSFGARHVDGSGTFMDYDGVTQPSGPDITTRGMQGLARRWYLDVYPALDGPVLGPAR
jgi:hypothetical protein